MSQRCVAAGCDSKAEGEISLHKDPENSVVLMPSCLKEDVTHSDYQIP